jgi:hypothetical protein
MVEHSVCSFVDLGRAKSEMARKPGILRSRPVIRHLPGAWQIRKLRQDGSFGDVFNYDEGSPSLDRGRISALVGG